MKQERADFAEVRISVHVARGQFRVFRTVAMSGVAVVIRVVRIGTRVADDVKPVVVMVITVRQQRVEPVANKRNAGVARQQNIAQELAVLGPHGAEAMR